MVLSINLNQRGDEMKKSIVILGVMLLFTIVTSDEANANPYYIEADFVTDSGLAVVEDFESYAPPIPDWLALDSSVPFADGSVVIETIIGTTPWDCPTSSPG